jgi:hypothetical protein
MRQYFIFLIMGLTLLYGTTDWSYDSETRLLHSISTGGDIQCASPDNENCIKGDSYSDIMNYFQNQPIKPLECGYMHSLKYGGQTGYDDYYHWCSLLLRKYAPMKDKAYFADEHENKIFHINYKDMQIVNSVDVNGTITHHADVVGSMDSPKSIMAVPKGSEIVEFYNMSTTQLEKRIDLTAEFGAEFKPRSGDAYNPTHNLLFLTAKNRPSGVIIDVGTLSVVAKVGENKTNSNIRDLGGDQVTGHPIWLDSDYCAVLNRADRTVDVYKVEFLNNQWSAHFVSSTPVETSLHQILAGKDGNYFYGVSEGNKYIHKPDIHLADGETKIAEFSVAPNYFAIMDTTFPTDAWGGINSLVVMDENGTKVFGEISVLFINNGTSYKSRDGYTFEESEDYPNFQYAPWYENVSVLRQVRHDDILGKTYRVFSYHLTLEQYNQFKGVLNGFDANAILQIVRSNNLFNDIAIVDNEIRFNNPNSTGIVPNMQSVTMDNSKYNDVNLLVGIKDQDFYINSGEPYKPSKVYKFRWDRSQEKLLVENSILLQKGSDVGFLGHNMSIDPYGKLVIPVGFTYYTENDHGIPFKGGVFIVNLDNFSIETFIKTGKGAGHIVFDTERKHGLITHHTEPYVSMYDYTTNQLIKHIPLKIKKANYSSTTQSHSPYVDINNRYMYNAWTDGGVFFRIDLESGEVEESSKVEIGGMPIQGNYFTTSSEQIYRPTDNEIITPLKLHDLILGAKYRANSLHIFVENGAYPQKIQFAQDPDIDVGTRLKITNGATNVVHMEGDINVTIVDEGSIDTFIYNGTIWEKM